MEDLLHQAIHAAAMLIEAMALIVVVIGTIEAFCTGIWTVLASVGNQSRPSIRVDPLRTLVDCRADLPACG